MNDVPPPDCCAHDAAPSAGSLTDSDLRSRIDRRLSRIEGQVRGLRRMVEERRWCVDVLVQIEAVQESLRGAGNELLSAHLRHCVADAARAGRPEALDERLDEIDALLRRRRS